MVSIVKSRNSQDGYCTFDSTFEASSVGSSGILVQPEKIRAVKKR